MPVSLEKNPKINIKVDKEEPDESSIGLSSGVKVHSNEQNTLPVPQREPSPARSHYSTASKVLDNEFVEPPLNYQAKFEWRKVGAFIDPQDLPSLEQLQERNTENLTKYISEKYYADLYWNCSLAIGMCISSWTLSFLGIGVFSFVIVAIVGFAMYRAEFRRFNVNIRDDMQRICAADLLEQQLESMNWLNNFFSKFWVIYMPALSDLVITLTNQILEGVEPPAPIDKVTLDEFTLGSKAPKIESIKSFTKLGADIYQMDWKFSFAPNDTFDMTANEMKNKVAPKVALGIRVGKGFVGASLPVLVENMTFKGLLRIKLKIGDTFPHIDVVSISFLEQPTIDYALKPVGGNTFGVDIMSVIPGLSSFVNGIVHSTLAPMLYAPNSFDINVNDIVESSIPSAIGVLAVKIRGVEYLVNNNDNKINPFVEFGTEFASINERYQTSIKSNTTLPIFNETQYILINNLQSRLKFQLMNLKADGDSDQLAETYFELQDLLQSHEMIMNETKLLKNNRNVGKIVYDLIWFPVLKSTEEQENDVKINPPSSDTGIFEFNLLAARNLDNSKSLLGKLSTYAEIYIDDKLIITSRLAKGTNNPEYKCKLERLIHSKATTSIKIVIKDISSYGETTVAEYSSSSLSDLTFVNTSKSHKIEFTTGMGEFKFSSIWKPLPSIAIHDDITFIPPMGTLRLHLVNASNLPNLETLGTIDPYAQILSGGVLKGESEVVKNSLNPKFDEVFYISLFSKNEKLQIRIMDVESGRRDREVGSFNIDLSKLMNDDSNQNTKLKFKGNLSRNGKPTGTVDYILSYYPLLPIYSRRELHNIVAKQKEDDEVSDLEELEEQAKFLKDYKKHPDDYEWIDDDTVIDDEVLNNNKIMMSINDAVKHKNGVLGINLITGQIKQRTAYVEALIDDRIYPDFISRKSTNGKFKSHSGDAFIRDLDNSIITFRLSNTERVYSNDQVIKMTEPYKVIDLLKNGYDEAYSIDLGGDIIQFMFEYIPAEIGMSSDDLITDTGLLNLKLVEGVQLSAGDKNGFSDPFAVVLTNNKQVFKTNVIKKTLNPEWNESTQVVIKSRERSNFQIKIYDWDMAGSNDLLGTVNLDLSKLNIDKLESWKLPVQGGSGEIQIETKFTPGYIRPGLGVITNNDSSLNVADPFGAALNVGSKGLNVAGGVAGGVAGTATDVAGGVLHFTGESAGGFLKTLSHIPTGHSNAHSHTDSNNANHAKRIPTLGFKPSIPGFDHFKSPPTASNASVRSSMDISSVHTDTFTGSDVLHGRGSIIKLVPNVSSGASYQLKVSMLSSSNKSKTIFKTKPMKIVDGEVRWHEQFALKCDPKGALSFEVRERHVLGKDKLVAQSKLNLSEITGVKDDITLDTSIGQVVLNFNYGA